MNHEHDHSHNHTHTGQRGLYFAAAITLAYAAIEAGVGWWANSLAFLNPDCDYGQQTGYYSI